MRAGINAMQSMEGENAEMCVLVANLIAIAKTMLDALHQTLGWMCKGRSTCLIRNRTVLDAEGKSELQPHILRILGTAKPSCSPLVVGSCEMHTNYPNSQRVFRWTLCILAHQ